MPDIHITRHHALGMAGARKLAFRWAEEAEERLGMECVYEEGRSSDLVRFTRLGAEGELKVTKDSFILDAQLGILLGAFKDKIETEIVKNLDKLLAQKDPLKAFDKGLADHDPPAAKKPGAKKRA
ncbi:MAG TPA: polyhydroxyalkanoic acid system family protein [Ramlibacter sp.]|nr:polyhydroxyalkanoic acid system family protein [Ramlibacter sp.]